MWTFTVALDADKSDVGTATAMFTENGQTFSFSRRLRVDVSERNAFISAAIQGRNAWRTRVAAESGYVANLTLAMTAADV